MPRIRYTRSAEADLLELWLTIAEENILAADSTLDSIQEQFHSWTVSLKWAGCAGNCRIDYAVSRRALPTSSLYLPDTEGLLIVGCCIESSVRFPVGQASA